MSDVDFSRYTRAYREAHPDEVEVIKEELSGVLEQGAAYWNGLVADYVRLIESKEILVTDGEKEIDFSGMCFSGIDFGGYDFPLAVRFVGATFGKGVSFARVKFSEKVVFDLLHVNDSLEHALDFDNDDVSNRTCFEDEVNFKGAVFKKVAYFPFAVFNKNADFRGAKFNENACFSAARFRKGVDFCDVKVDGDFLFDSAFCSGVTSDFSIHVMKNCQFNDAVFDCEVAFNQAVFKSYAFFSGITFRNGAFFSEARFEGISEFAHCKFESEASFLLTQTYSLDLANAKFNKVPDFRYALFERPPYVSNISVPDEGSADPSNVLRYRKLKEMAIASHDHQKEVEFFGYEVKAKRGVESFGVSTWPGYVYQVGSNFGRSLWRPVAVVCCAWLFAFVLVGALKLPHWFNDEPALLVVDGVVVREHVGWEVVRYTSLVSFPLLASSRGEVKALREIIFAKEEGAYQYWHRWLASVQQGFTFLGLFLFGLGLRNRFKIK